MAPWLIKSLLAVVLLTPAWLAMPFFDRNFQVPASTFLIWYFAGGALAVAVWTQLYTPNPLVPSVGVVVAILILGIVAGGLANALLFSAVTEAPNPGLAVAISNVAAVTVLLCAWLLAQFMPKYFAPVQLDMRTLFGVLLVIVGVGVISVR